MLSVSADRESQPNRCRAVAKIETANASGVLSNTMLGPSDVRGCPQQKVTVNPTPINGSVVRINAAQESIVSLLGSPNDLSENKLPCDFNYRHQDGRGNGEYPLWSG